MPLYFLSHFHSLPLLPLLLLLPLSPLSLPHTTTHHHHRYVFNFFGSVAECLGPAFNPFLADLIPIMLDACLSRAVEFHEVEDDDLRGGGSNINFGEEEEEATGGDGDGGIDLNEEDDDDDDGMYRAKVRTGLMDLKEAAIVNLGRIAAACAGYEEGGGSGSGSSEGNGGNTPDSDPFAPFVERTLDVMKQLTVYFHEQVKVKSIGVLRNMVLGSYQVSKGGLQGSAVWQENQRRCQALVSAVLPMLLLRMNKDFNREVCAVSVEAVDAIVHDLGSSSIEPHLDALVQQLLLYLQGKAACQESEDDVEEEDEALLGEGEDHDFVLMDSVTDLVGTLARSFGGRFAGHAQPLLMPLGKYLAPNRPHTDRSMAIGCYAELVQGMGAEMGGQHCASMLQVAQTGLRDGHHEVKVGVFFFFLGSFFVSFLFDFFFFNFSHHANRMIIFLFFFISLFPAEKRMLFTGHAVHEHGQRSTCHTIASIQSCLVPSGAQTLR